MTKGYPQSMDTDIFVVASLIVILSVVQSYFGMGLLIFGTPSLLLLGYDFYIALTYLLPASFVISLLQILPTNQKRPSISTFLYLVCLPGIGFGLWAAGSRYYSSWINAVIGVILLVSALSRLWPLSTRRINTLLQTYSGAYHLVMGLIHGLTNLGGALLVLLASSMTNNKNQIRYTIAFYYLVFSFVQLFILAFIMDHLDDVINHASTAVVSGLVYSILGNRIFEATGNQTYNTAITLFIAAFGSVLLLKFWGSIG